MEPLNLPAVDALSCSMLTKVSSKVGPGVLWRGTFLKGVSDGLAKLLRVPPSMPFEHPFVAADSDVDALGHVNNVAYIRWIQDVAVAHSAAVGWDLAAYQRLGAIFVVRRHEVDYLKPVNAGDQMVASTWIAEASGAKCLRMTELRRMPEGEVVARGCTTWVLIQLGTGRPLRIQPDVLSAFGFGAGSGVPA